MGTSEQKTRIFNKAENTEEKERRRIRRRVGGGG